MESNGLKQPSSPLEHLCVSIVPIFNHLEQAELKEVAATTKGRKLPKGEILYRAGEKSNSLYIIHKGKLKVYRLTESGKEQVIRILQPGDFTGELALFTDNVHDSYAEAMEATELCTISSGDINDLFLKYPQISLKIIKEFSLRLDQAEHQVTSFTTEDTETRVALYLIQQAESSQSKEIRLPMSRKDLASYLGTTPETISRKLAKFEDEGWIQQFDQRAIRIVDMENLSLYK
ncbi:Crp/Fnr family transcriptional regulator [Planococcus sp. APC 3900]|uniref:Crp/Fnr family transcriptional regulator n=1 Tax=Planococcus sp. APC 3900 TaxID=3035191 RepID=UPI0025B61690|nr:Crp/Fnr family transcriptional regulator [Planococcus sp. APC 3900]MDN3438921.1 Crp/Fnr family transcriptional regulator [Planococcus sp. APC 3900]